MQWTIDATIASTGAKATLVVEAARGEVTLSGPGARVRLDEKAVAKLRRVLGRAEGVRSDDGEVQT